jgi:hypothetical protein
LLVEIAPVQRLPALDEVRDEIRDVRLDVAVDEVSAVSESLRRAHTSQGGSMRFSLFALSGTSNASIHDALVERGPGMTR